MIGLNHDRFQDMFVLRLSVALDQPGAWLIEQEADSKFSSHFDKNVKVELLDRKGRPYMEWIQLPGRNDWRDNEYVLNALAFIRGVAEMELPVEVAAPAGVPAGESVGENFALKGRTW